MFDFFFDLIARTLAFFYDLVPSYGVAVIGLTLMAKAQQRRMGDVVD